MPQDRESGSFFPGGAEPVEQAIEQDQRGDSQWREFSVKTGQGADLDACGNFLREHLLEPLHPGRG